MPRASSQHALARRALIPSQHALARRALIEDTEPRYPSRVRQGFAVLGISVLGLGVAGSVVGHAADSTTQRDTARLSVARPSVERQAGVVAPAALVHRAAGSGSFQRPTLAAAALRTQAEQRSVSATDRHISPVAQAKAGAKARAAKAATRRAAAHAEAKAKAKASAAPGTHSSPGSQEDLGRTSRPITARYRVAARFGATGVWARHHTGLDFAAPRGTTIRAVVAGTVTHAGSGGPGWAGRYVTIRHADGKTTLYAHLSAVSVHKGERVRGGERIGSVGMTGRTFGPHLHMELYPRGVRPGDVYRAVNPGPWLHRHGVHY